jgi:hypothetical protein
VKALVKLQREITQVLRVAIIDHHGPPARTGAGETAVGGIISGFLFCTTRLTAFSSNAAIASGHHRTARVAEMAQLIAPYGRPA